MAKIIGYYILSLDSRTNTLRNSTLKDSYKCDKIFYDHIEDETSRPALKEALNVLTQGDTFIVISLGNTIREFNKLPILLSFMLSRGINLISIEEGIDTAGKMFPSLSSMKWVEIISSLPKKIRAVKIEYLQVQSYDPILESPEPIEDVTKAERNALVINLYQMGVTVSQIMAMAKIGRNSVYNILDRAGIRPARAKGRPKGAKNKPKKNKNKNITDSIV